MFEEVGTLFGVLIVMLFCSVLMDAFVIFRIMIKQSADAMEYASYGLKWPKIVIMFLFGLIMLFYAFAADNSTYVMIIELILGLLLIADGVLSAIIKRKFGADK